MGGSENLVLKPKVRPMGERKVLLINICFVGNFIIDSIPMKFFLDLASNSLNFVY